MCNFEVLGCYRTIDRYDKEQTSPLTSLEARWLVPAPAQQQLTISPTISKAAEGEQKCPPVMVTRFYSIKGDLFCVLGDGNCIFRSFNNISSDLSVKGKGRQLARSNVEGEYLDGCELIHDQCVTTIN